MFDFEKLEVYKKARDFLGGIRATILKNSQLDNTTKNQLTSFDEHIAQHC